MDDRWKLTATNELLRSSSASDDASPPPPPPPRWFLRADGGGDCHVSSRSSDAITLDSFEAWSYPAVPEREIDRWEG